MKLVEKPRIVVLGASGFFGRHVCTELVRRGQSVVAMTRSRPPASSPGVEWHEVTAYGGLDRLSADACVHLAEPNVVSGSGFARDNFDRAAAVLATPFRRIVYVSSAVVYGDEVATPRREDEPVDPTSEYGRSKLAIEQQMAANERCVIARVANAYGPGMSPANVLSDILSQLASPGPLRLRDLDPVRDYVHVVDVARAIADLIACSMIGIVNIGTGIGTSVGTLARLATTLAGQPSRDLVGAQATGRASTLVVAIDRAQRELHWQPAVPLIEGVSELIGEHKP